MASRYVSGTHNAICDICGFEYKRNQMQKTWDGLLVCREDYDPKHPQLIVRTAVEKVSVADARPDNVVVDDVGVPGADVYAIVNFDGVQYEVPQIVQGTVPYFVGRFIDSPAGDHWELYKSRLARGFA